MRASMPIIAILTTLPAAALAHPGHMAEAAGHNHWIAGAAIGAAVLIGAVAAVRGWRKSAEACADDAAQTDADAEPEEGAREPS